MNVIKKQLKRSSHKKGKAAVKEAGVIRRKYTSVDKNSTAMRRAKEIQANLTQGFPSLVRFMLVSYVTGGYWLGLPKKFCTNHLPKQDAVVVLVDEDAKEWKIKYLYDRCGLSAGWRGFSISHNLVPGDALVFRLLQPCKFQVYIVKEMASTNINSAAISLLHLSHQPTSTENQQACLPLTRHGKMEDEPSMSPSDLSASADENSSSGLRFAESAPDFSQVKDFRSFHILANGLIIDSEVSRDVREKYFHLCRTHNSYLHQHLIEGLNCMLISGIISEIVNIADGIRASRLIDEPGCQHLEAWDATLKGFECLGMEIRFLRDRLQKLITISYESSEEATAQRRERRAILKAQLKDMRRKKLKAKEEKRSLDEEMEFYNNEDGIERMFRDVATAPW